MHDIREVAATLDLSRETLLGRRNVVATGVGFKQTGAVRTGEVGIVCSVERKVPLAELASSDIVPRTLAGVPTDVVETGPLRLLSAAHRERHRPAPGGVSVGHRDVTAGTFGCVVRRGGERFVLSNNHVLANTNAAEPGDPVLQPAAYDGGRIPADAIGVLERFVPIEMADGPSTCVSARLATRLLNGVARFLGSGARFTASSTRVPENLVDAALALPLEDSLLAEEVLGIGPVTGQTSAQLGMAVRKSGRTTGVTSGEIVQVHVTANVLVGTRTARFTDQLMAGPMSQGGDSGSLVVDEAGRAVGLLFAGSDATTLCNRIEHVIDALEVTL